MADNKAITRRQDYSPTADLFNLSPFCRSAAAQR